MTAQSSLPLANLGIEHLDIVVPDPAASARWYARIFHTSLHQQPVRDTLRYFVPEYARWLATQRGAFA